MMPPVSQYDIKSEESINIGRHDDAIYAQVRARSLASHIGFSKDEQWKIGIAVSEAATNIVKFAKSGKIIFREIKGKKIGFEFEALDNGPGISDLESALKDGFSEGIDYNDLEIEFRQRRGLGSGLAAINRMMDSFTINSNKGEGTRIVARKFLEQ